MWGAQLTPECMDLLNKIFVIDQNQRITVPNIKAHPWYTKPMLDKYQAAEGTLAKRQEQLNAYVSQRQLNSVRSGVMMLFFLHVYIVVLCRHAPVHHAERRLALAAAGCGFISTVSTIFQPLHLQLTSVLAGRQKALVARNEQLQKLVEESGKRAALPDGRPRTAPLVRSGQLHPRMSLAVAKCTVPSARASARRCRTGGRGSAPLAPISGRCHQNSSLAGAQPMQLRKGFPTC